MESCTACLTYVVHWQDTTVLLLVGRGRHLPLAGMERHLQLVGRGRHLHLAGRGRHLQLAGRGHHLWKVGRGRHQRLGGPVRRLVGRQAEAASSLEVLQGKLNYLCKFITISCIS